MAASALSAAGASAGCAVASARLGLSRITFASDMDVDDDRGVRVARADYLAGRDDISRIEELLSAAVRAVVAR
ncbi:MAG TPA: hypothetical protein VMU50_02840, partial [Polyangia bacterium]|nr:hypothetical protein [Polyangia bacterium]